MRLLMVVPTYNERDNIGRLVREIISQPVQAEVIVVDDASPDGTGALVAGLAAIGAAVGALGGGLMGSALEAQDKKIQQQQTPVATSRSKFCPVGGELYGEDVKYCPNHGVELRYKE